MPLSVFFRVFFPWSYVSHVFGGVGLVHCPDVLGSWWSFRSFFGGVFFAFLFVGGVVVAFCFSCFSCAGGFLRFFFLVC